MGRRDRSGLPFEREWVRWVGRWVQVRVRVRVCGCGCGCAVTHSRPRNEVVNLDSRLEVPRATRTPPEGPE